MPDLTDRQGLVDFANSGALSPQAAAPQAQSTGNAPRPTMGDVFGAGMSGAPVVQQQPTLPAPGTAAGAPIVQSGPKPVQVTQVGQVPNAYSNTPTSPY